jgi:hypothetical protein
LPTESLQTCRSRIAALISRFSVVLLGFILLCCTRGQGQNRFFENGNPLPRNSDASFSLSTSTRVTIDLSGQWECTLENGSQLSIRVPSAYDFAGSVIFERSFSLTQEQLDRYSFRLIMLGVNYAADISVNGEYIATHVGGYTTVDEPLHAAILQQGGENTLRLAVNNILDAKSTLPLRPQVWGMRNYGGILRDVYLLGTPRLSIADAVVHSELSENGQSARVIIRAAIEGSDTVGLAGAAGKPSGIGLSCELVDKISGAVVGRSSMVPLVRRGSQWDDARADIIVQNPKMWTPETPDLYVVRCLLVRAAGKEIRVLDDDEIITGIRTVGIDGNRILLNRKRLVVHGVTWYEDHPAWGSALTYEQREKDVVLMKNLGANAVRFAGHPPHPYMLDLCDRYGLMAMVELPVVQEPGGVLAREGTLDLASGMLREMVTGNRNHPSVLAWGLGDEFESSHPAARGFVGALARLARTLDSRPLYFGAVPGADSCADLVDIAAVNVGTHDLKTFRSTVEAWRNAHKDQPVIAAKFGAEVEPGNRNGTSDPFSQESQARFCVQRCDILKSLDYDGAIVWSFNDWRGDRPALTVHSGDPYEHTMGLVNGNREKRLAYDAVRAAFHGEKFIALATGSHASGTPIVFVLSGFVVLVGMAYVYNANRRFRECLNRSFLNAYNFFADVRDQRLVSVGHSTLLGAVVSLAVAITSSSILFRFRDNLVLDDLLSSLLVFDGLKAAAVSVIWNPLRCITVTALSVFVLLLLVAGVVHVFRLFTRARISGLHAYTVTMWSTAPLVILIPIGMIVYRVMDSSVYVVPTFILLLLLKLWVFFRLLKGIAIVVDYAPLKMYVIGVLTVAFIVGAAFVYYDYAESLPMYVSFCMSTVVHLQ